MLIDLDGLGPWKMLLGGKYHAIMVPFLTPDGDANQCFCLVNN